MKSRVLLAASIGVVAASVAIWLFPRDSIKEDEIAGWHIPAGATLFMLPYVTHRNPDYWVDPERFEDTITPIVEQAAGSRKRLVRIYGEMVDVLWNSGREDAALSLEHLWHQLVAGRKCSLLCGYSSAVRQGEGFDTICDRHSHVVPSHTLTR